MGEHGFIGVDRSDLSQIFIHSTIYNPSGMSEGTSSEGIQRADTTIEYSSIPEDALRIESIGPLGVDSGNSDSTGSFVMSDFVMAFTDSTIATNFLAESTVTAAFLSGFTDLAEAAAFVEEAGATVAAAFVNAAGATAAGTFVKAAGATVAAAFVEEATATAAGEFVKAAGATVAGEFVKAAGATDVERLFTEFFDLLYEHQITYPSEVDTVLPVALFVKAAGSTDADEFLKSAPSFEVVALFVYEAGGTATGNFVKVLGGKSAGDIT